jgi:hypothetical protein
MIYLMRQPAAQWHGLILNYYLEHSVSHWPLTNAQVWSQTSLCGIYGQRSKNWTPFSPHTSVFPTVSIYHFSILNHLGLTLYNLIKGGTILTYHKGSEEYHITLGISYRQNTEAHLAYMCKLFLVTNLGCKKSHHQASTREQRKQKLCISLGWRAPPLH